MIVYYKATGSDGYDFRTRTINYAAALVSGDPVQHPAPHFDGASGYLSISVEPGETLIGGEWPCRLFEVQPIGEVQTTRDYPHKRAVHALRMVREVEAWRALGPQGAEIEAFISSIVHVVQCNARESSVELVNAASYAVETSTVRRAKNAARLSSRLLARNAAGNIAEAATRFAVSEAIRITSLGAWVPFELQLPTWPKIPIRLSALAAVEALLVRDRITEEHFNTLMRPWRILSGEEI